METKNLLVFAGGLVVGYFVATQMNLKHESTESGADNEMTETTEESSEVVCPPFINCMPMVSDAAGYAPRQHPYCTNMPQECVGITAKAS